MDGDAHVGHVIDELGVEGERSPFDDDAAEVVVPVASGRAADLVVGADVAVQEELHGRAGIENLTKRYLDQARMKTKAWTFPNGKFASIQST